MVGGGVPAEGRRPLARRPLRGRLPRGVDASACPTPAPSPTSPFLSGAWFCLGPCSRFVGAGVLPSTVPRTPGCSQKDAFK